jgi:signal transduction histidine kinase/CheY-like chemotaxis protein
VIHLKNKKQRSGVASPLSSQFEKERKKIIIRAVTLGSLLCTILVPLFFLLDLVSKPHMLWPFAILRLFVTVVCGTVYFASKTSLGKRFPYILSLIVALSVCGSIAMMCRLDQGPEDPYYAGINLPILGFAIMFPLNFRESISMFSLVWLTYFLPNFIILQPYEIDIFVSNNFFMISTIIISVVSCKFNFHHRKNQWNAHRRLQSAHRKIKNHADELEKKVQERTQRLLQSERLAVVGQLAGGIAHDFNNILTAILGISELILSTIPKDDPLKLREDIESISRVGQRAVDLVKQLLAFSRRQILVTKTLNLNMVITDIEKMLKRLIGEDIELVVKTEPKLGNVQADPVQIEQIILNLSVNARDAMPKGGKLIIQTANVKLDTAYCKLGKVSLIPGDYVMMAVSDTGTGMSEDVKSKVFEPFFTTKEKGQGTGLGLSTVYGIVKQSHGDILVYSEENKGTTLKVYLPLVKQPTHESRKPVKNGKKLPRGKETILLVEDEDEVRNLTARVLQKQGYNVLKAKEGKSALSLAESYEGSIDLLVTDVIMPYMNGKALAEQLTTKRTDLKVLYISGHIDSMITQHGILEDNVEFLQKPFTADSLSHKIRSVFDN